VMHNVVLAVLPQISRHGFTNSRTEEAIYANYKQRLSVKAATPGIRVRTLSGGNQQKIVLAKWLATKPRLLILDEPTRGIDVGAKAEVHGLISELAEQGLAIILISSEMPEIMGLSHRVLTMLQGVITGEFEGATASEEALMTAIMHRADTPKGAAQFGTPLAEAG
jgi:ABC-type sugar transport system ATPase subunit